MNQYDMELGKEEVSGFGIKIQFFDEVLKELILLLDFLYEFLDQIFVFSTFHCNIKLIVYFRKGYSDIVCVHLAKDYTARTTINYF